MTMISEKEYVLIKTDEHLTVQVFGGIYKICYHAVVGNLNRSEAKLEVSDIRSHALEFLNQAKPKLKKLSKIKSMSFLKNRIQQAMVELPQQEMWQKLA